MIAFNELRISDNKSCIYLDLYIEDTVKYPNMRIEGIYLEYYKNANETTTYSEKALVVYEYTEGEPEITEYSEPIYASSLSMDENGVNTFAGGLFHLIVHCYDGEESYVDIAAVLDWQKVYALGMMSIANFTSACNDRCAIPADFEHFVLVYHALSLALETCDLTQIDKIWDRFINMEPGITAAFNCNC